LFAYWIVAGYAPADLAPDTATLIGLTGTLVLAWSLLLSQAMESVTRAFYTRSDLDLILTAPASARKVFAVRMGRIAGSVVALAGALVHEPRIIILDEPLTGLDAGSARQVKTVLRERVAAGGTVIMTTHILEFAERMADRNGVIAGGRLIAEGTLEELRRKTGAAAASLEDTFLTLVAEEAA
jgi:ABC-type branched-subunit amino acid transport system ATPase component